ncbi:MAG: 3-oxoacyl-ACP synthase [Candidatus Omnitrophica bacterium CG1_02_49_10]|nr:MAG: 3-oxoacyl-ACP synthase [Candidatus Omnitrophica bacterium CG1_02_49_10]
MEHKKRRVGIVGVGKYLPEKVLTNADLEKMVDTSDEWIVTRTGIKERRIAEPGTPTSDLASKAALQAIARAGMKPEDIELIIVATVTGDMAFPSTACVVQDKIKAYNSSCFDISAACTGYIYALATAEQFIANGTYRNALVIGAEVITSSIDWKDRSTCVLFGDGAGACVLSSVDEGGILGSYLASDGRHASLLERPGGGSRMPLAKDVLDNRMHFLKMQGNEIFKLAVRYMLKAAENVLEKCQLEIGDIKCFIPHQANMRIIDAIMKRLSLPPSKVYLNIERYGNMSAASTAVALSEAIEYGVLKKGDKTVLVAFGSGLTSGSCVIEI